MVFTILRTRPRKNCFLQSINQAVVRSAMPIAMPPSSFTCGLRCSRGTEPCADRTPAPASRAALPPGLMPGPPCRRRRPEWAGPASERRRQLSARSAFLCQGARPVSPPAARPDTTGCLATRSPPGSLVEVSATESRGECRGREMAAPGPSRRLLLRQPARRWLHGPGPARGGSSLPHAPLRAPPRGPRGAAAAPRLWGRGA